MNKEILTIVKHMVLLHAVFLILSSKYVTGTRTVSHCHYSDSNYQSMKTSSILTEFGYCVEHMEMIIFAAKDEKAYTSLLCDEAEVTTNVLCTCHT